ncbi:hypothetical protein B1R32_103162 [Abditibacterium utsteinense]|uniref:Uncharacterized protein n=1 Tax=Abditibacterium utsteinense TaxID=1960156 RepID=A0A2S8SVS8_9BACT|nr:hypothetical protein [Abditibacterium utsteinense]PQV64895.1 hypothetical protein B1R32_103162 [Abditibacterium utsteinense]
MPDSLLPPATLSQNGASLDLAWVWREVRKRVFTKLPFSLSVAETLEAVIPIALDGDHFVVGLDLAHSPMAANLSGGQVKNTIENILRQAAGRAISFELIEGTTLEEWHQVAERREKAHAAVIAMASKQVEAHHFEDVLNQIVGEIRQRVAQVHERMLPQVRASLMLDMVPSLADAEEMLFNDAHSREGRRAMSRAIDRIATFLEVPPLTLALEIERYRRSQKDKIEH